MGTPVLLLAACLRGRQSRQNPTRPPGVTSEPATGGPEPPGRLPRVLVTGFPSAVFGTNCYVVAAGRGGECLVVDPGMELLDRMGSVLRKHLLRPATVLVTRGS